MIGATSPTACGIKFGLSGGAIDGNRVTNSPYGVCLAPNSGSTATRNSFYNIATNVFSGYTGNDVPPIVAANSATNPLANICVSPPGTCVSTP
jgi:parallel beta-helix repeat protein